MNLQKKPKAPKLPKCKICKKGFVRQRSMQQVCSYSDSPECAKEFAKQKSIKDATEEVAKQRNEHRAAVVKAKPRSYWMKAAQVAFNSYIRARDSIINRPCISCGSFTGKKNAGHYRSVGSTPELRFEPLNCHLQCEKCNSYLSGNLINYRIALIKLIGLNAVEWLESNHPPRNYSIDELKEIRVTYTKKAKELTK